MYWVPIMCGSLQPQWFLSMTGPWMRDCQGRPSLGCGLADTVPSYPNCKGDMNGH